MPLIADERLGLLRELARADEAIAAEIVEVDGLYDTVEELRERARELREFFGRLPDERAAAAEALSGADRVLAEARAAAEQAAGALVRAEADGDGDRLAEARRFDVRARDSVHVAESRAVSAREHAGEFEARAAAAKRETAELETQARELATELRRRSRLSDAAVATPGPGSEGVAEWGTRARAALLVASGQLAAERDAVVRQAHELGALVLDEPLPTLGAAAVVQRVERVLET